jgi:hypothetical protein
LLAYITGQLLRPVGEALAFIRCRVGHFPKPVRTLLAGVLRRLRWCHDILL